MPRNRFEQPAERCVPGVGPLEIRPLTSGLVNESCRVTRAGKMYSLRIAAVDGQDLGLDRRWECAVRVRAGAAGLAPAMHCCDAEGGILVADWAAGRTWSAAEARLPQNLDFMAQLLRRVHSLEIPLPARCMDPAGWIAHYRAALLRDGRGAATPGSAKPVVSARGAAGADVAALGVATPGVSTPGISTPGVSAADALFRSTALPDASETYLAKLAAHPVSDAVLCHSDLHRFNLLIGDRPVLLDWEYAHVSDGFWDLAGWVANNDWTPVEAERLLAAYLQRPTRTADLERLEIWMWLYDYVCLLWSELYSRRRPGAERHIAARADLLATRLARGADRELDDAHGGGRARWIPAH